MFETDFEKKSNEQIDNAFKKLFSNRINGNFLIEIKNKVVKLIGAKLAEYFYLKMDAISIATGINDLSYDYEICRMIVGCHRANTIFLSPGERGALQRDSKYREKLINQVVTHIKIRDYSSIFYRKKQLLLGDEFLYFPVLYKLFALSNYGLSIVNGNMLRAKLYIDIFEKSLAAMTMIENNFMDSAYPLIRAIIELYFKSMVVENKQISDDYNAFIEWGIHKTASNIYTEDFLKRFDSRIRQDCSNKLQYLHYGWVDSISDYHKIVKNKPYSIDGIFDYIYSKVDEGIANQFEGVRAIYNRCHEYSHGNIGNQGYPLLFYFELTIALYYAITFSYSFLCIELNKNTRINDIDVLGLVKEEFGELILQYEKRSTENFEKYYQQL